MDPKEAMKLIAYAKKMGVKSLAVGALSFTFHDAAPPPHSNLPEHRANERSAPEPATAESKTPTPHPVPTLDQINQYIYGDSEDAHEPVEQH